VVKFRLMAVTMLAAALMLGGCGSSSSDPANPSVPPAGGGSSDPANPSVPPAGGGDSNSDNGNSGSSNDSNNNAANTAIIAKVAKTWGGTYMMTDEGSSFGIGISITKDDKGGVKGFVNSAKIHGKATGTVTSDGAILFVIANGADDGKTWKMELKENNGKLGISAIYSPNQGALSVGSGSCDNIPFQVDKIIEKTYDGTFSNILEPGKGFNLPVSVAISNAKDFTGYNLLMDRNGEKTNMRVIPWPLYNKIDDKFVMTWKLEIPAGEFFAGKKLDETYVSLDPTYLADSETLAEWGLGIFVVGASEHWKWLTQGLTFTEYSQKGMYVLDIEL